MAGGAERLTIHRWLDVAALCRSVLAGLFAVGVSALFGWDSWVLALIVPWCIFVVVLALMTRVAENRGGRVALGPSTASAAVGMALLQVALSAWQFSRIGDLGSPSATVGFVAIGFVWWPLMAGALFAGGANIATRLGRSS